MTYIPDPNWTLTSREELERIAAEMETDGPPWDEAAKQYFAFYEYLTCDERFALNEMGAEDVAVDWIFSNGGRRCEIRDMRRKGHTVTVIIELDETAERQLHSEDSMLAG